MPEIIDITVYRLDELSDAAKDKARAWYREGCFDYEWYDAVYEDFQRIAEILGVRFKTRTVRLMPAAHVGRRASPLHFCGGSSRSIRDISGHRLSTPSAQPYGRRFFHVGHGASSERKRKAGTGLSQCGPERALRGSIRSRSPRFFP